MKKFLALLLALVMVFALAACGEPAGEETTPAGEETTPAGEETAPAGDMPVVKIGVFEPLTGDSGAGGKQEMLGMQYAHSCSPPS